MNNIEIIARGIFERDGKILLCQSLKHGYFFLPGGHVEFGESGEVALEREMKEETGLEISGPEFVGVFEQGFSQEGEKHHEINLLYKSELKDAENTEVVSKEAQIDFKWLEIEKLVEVNFLPQVFAEALLKWHRDRELIFLSRFED